MAGPRPDWIGEAGERIRGIDMLRVDENPLARYPEGRPLEADTGNWVVAHLKSRQEKAFAHDLVREGIPYYLPMVEKRTRRRDNGKLRKSILPLFPGYVAVAAPEGLWEELYKRHRLSSLIPVTLQEEFTQELLKIHRVLASTEKVETAPLFSEGQRVRVKAGPLMGLEGEVVSYQGETMFLLRVSMFQQAVRVEIEDAYLEAIS